MRMQLNKLTKIKSTKAERRFSERLKAAHIPFKTKIIINNREVDFLIGKYAVDIDGHKQDKEKNDMLFQEGYIPEHIDNNSVLKVSIKHYV